MSMQLKPPPLPSADKRWRIVESTMRRHGWAGHALIESLHIAQETFGFLDDQALRYIGAGLRVPLSKVFGVATFYHFFSLKPPGEHSCVVCMGTACYIKGAPECLAAVEEKYEVKAGETTEDRKLSVLTARCVGSCGLAPVVVLDGNVIGRVDPASVLGHLEGLVTP
jgi:bidirectional [NiFe] hydrogenase diaphorase subunit